MDLAKPLKASEMFWNHPEPQGGHFKSREVLHICEKRSEQPLGAHMRIACFIVQAFYKRSAEKGQSNHHCICIKENKTIHRRAFCAQPIDS